MKGTRFAWGRAVAGFAIAVFLMAAPAGTAQDTWETLPDVPFSYGVSSGGGLATDGAYLYAADFSGDADTDYIDIDGNGAYSTGESLGELGIPNGSVRIARYDPGPQTWEFMPAINASGVSGDAFSSGNLNGSLFHASGQLYYYQYRAGPNRCVLYRYDLADGLTGSWTEVWNLSESEALIGANAGLTGAVGPDGPVILHHKGGGSYNFYRSTGIDGLTAETHVKLTPFWAFNSNCFPKNGAFAYDAVNGRIFHMSGDQLLHWDPSPAYAPEDFLTAIPNGSDDLAVFTRTIFSLDDTLGWDPGGSDDPQGSSLWGNDIVVVNDPSGHDGGPNGEDTGSNVLYLIRGETSQDTWPFNESRGLITNGDFARYFPSTGAAQNLPSAPFNIGKGAAACYLNGCVYVLQGETATSADDAGNNPPINRDGIRIPGTGFARFNLRPETVTGDPVIPIGQYIGEGLVSLVAPADNGTGTAPLFDRDWESIWIADADNPASVTVIFNSPTETGAARAAFGDADHGWSLEAANSLDDLDSGTGTWLSIVAGQFVPPGDIGWDEWNAAPVWRSHYRFTVENLESGPVEILELELQRPKPLVTIDHGGTPVEVNHLEIVPAETYALVGDRLALTAEASISLGPLRYDVSLDASWSSSSPSVASVAPDGTVDALAEGTATISADLDPLSATASITVSTIGPQDDDVSVAWIHRLPEMDFVWESDHPETEGWPAVGSEVTWRAMVKNWLPLPREDVSYRWLLNGTQIASGRADLDPATWTAVDLPRTWTFDREELTFEIDSEEELTEVSEDNNSVMVYTDSISVAFWVEQSLYDYFHDYQHELGIGSNGWEDWAQRQVVVWNQMFADAIHPVDMPEGILDRIRLDKITVVEDGALPLQGGSYPTNYPDTSDRTIDLMWGFPATLVGHGMYSNHTDPVKGNYFYYEDSLIHELGHARYLIDCYGFGIYDEAAYPFVHVTHGGVSIAGTPYLPRSWKWWNNVHEIRPGVGSPFDGLMNTHSTPWVDRYSAMALNRIAGHRATRGNYNAPYNIGEFIDDLPAENTIQLIDGYGQPIASAAVSLYQAEGVAGGWYSKEFDDIADGTFTADAMGCVTVGQNPFADGELMHTYGGSTMVALLKVEAGGKTGFACMDAGLFNMEYWRGHTDNGYYSLTVPMVGNTREIAAVHVWNSNGAWRVQIIAGGDVQPASVMVDAEAASYDEGSWWAFPDGGEGPRLVTATWTGGPTITRWIDLPAQAAVPALVTAPPAAPGNIGIGWESRAGYAYDIEWSPDLETWTDMPGMRTFGQGDFLEADVPHLQPRDLYRLRVYPLGPVSSSGTTP